MRHICSDEALFVGADLWTFPQATSISKLISSSSHIHLSNLFFFHHFTWNSTRNAHGLLFTINYLTPLPTNPAMPGAGEEVGHLLILISALGNL